MKAVRIATLPGHTFAVEASDGRHTVVIDEPRENDGEDFGPSTYEVLLASLGACKAITMRMYARRKEWPLEDVTVELTHDKVHPRDLPEASPEEVENAPPNARVDVIRSTITVRGPLDAEQVARLHEIADRCPITRTLQNLPKLYSTIEHGA